MENGGREEASEEAAAPHRGADIDLDNWIAADRADTPRCETRTPIAGTRFFHRLSGLITSCSRGMDPRSLILWRDTCARVTGIFDLGIIARRRNQGIGIIVILIRGIVYSIIPANYMYRNVQNTWIGYVNDNNNKMLNNNEYRINLEWRADKDNQLFISL